MKHQVIFKTDLLFLLSMVLALCLRAVYLNETIAYLQPGSGSDAYFYLHWAEDIVRGNLLGKQVFTALPLYPYFLSLIYLFSAGETFNLVLIQVLLGSFNCGLIYILAKRVFNRQAAMLAAIIACGYFMFIFYDRMLLPTSFAISLGLAFSLLIFKFQDNLTPKRCLGLGLFLGLAALANASFAALFFFVLVWIIYEYRKRSLRLALFYCLTFILSFLLIGTALAGRNYLVAGEPVLATAHSGINFYIGNNAQADGLFRPPRYMRATQSGLIEDARIVAEQASARRLKAAEASRFWFRRAVDFMKQRPLAYLKLLGRKLILFFSAREFVDEIEYYIFNEQAAFFRFARFNFAQVFPLAVLGMFFSWRQRKRVIFLYLFVLSFSLSTISFFVNSRYRLMILPYLIIFAGWALWGLWQRYRQRQYKNLILSLGAAGLLFFLINVNGSGESALLTATFYYNKGIYAYDRGDYQKSRQEFQAALRIDPRDFMSYLGLGNVYYQIQDYAAAIDSYKRALAINPYFYKAHFNLGFVHQERGQLKKAEQAFKQVLALKPDDCVTHYNLGRVYQAWGRPQQALKAYQQALEIAPDNREILQAIEKIQDED